MRTVLPLGATSFAIPLATVLGMTLAVSLATTSGAIAASAVQKECSTKYQAAKTAGTLNGMSYNQYYKQCAAEAKTEKATPAAPAPTPAATAPVAPVPVAPKTTAATPVAPAPTTTAKAPPAPATIAKAPATSAAASGAVLPTAISPTFASQTPHLGRLHTCAEQWKTNKANNANGTLKWPAYYSECNTRLKG